MATFKRPLVALLVSPGWEQRRAILEGRVTVSIRPGYRDGYDVGRPLMLCCQIDPWCVMADITFVRHCLLAEVTAKEILDQGFDGRAKLMNFMLKFYPDLTENDGVTVINWGNVRGKLVEDWNKLRKIGPSVLQDSPRESSF